MLHVKKTEKTVKRKQQQTSLPRSYSVKAPTASLLETAGGNGFEVVA